MDPILSEILRIKLHEPVRADVMLRWQRHIRDTIAPALDELDALKAKRGPGRPRKDESEAIPA